MYSLPPIILEEGSIRVNEALSERLSAAAQARSTAELAPLVADLPEFSEGEGSGGGGERRLGAAAASRPSLNTGRVAASDTVAAILGGTDRKGRWRPARRTRVLTLLGGTDLDFSEALLPPGVTEVRVYCMLGGVDIVVPPALR